MNGVGYLILRLVDLMKNNEIVFEKQKNRIATITFNRPDHLNAISFDGWKQLTQISEELKKDNFVRVVVVSGSGDKSFSTGADIKDFEKNRFDSTSAKKYAEVFDGALDSLESLPQPVISMIHGFCVGGGCELSMATDLRIASEGSKLGHVNCRTGKEFKKFMEKYFDNVLLFSMNDEVVHTGFEKMAHYLFVVCSSIK